MRLRLLALVTATLLVAAGCWNYPKDVVADAADREEPEDAEAPEDMERPEDIGADRFVPEDIQPETTILPDGKSLFHPVGWTAPGKHGKAANLNSQDCTMCHGKDLAGGTIGIGCDGCHPSEWRTTCTFCHGGTDNDTGAPPQGLDGGASIFPSHTAHVIEGNHPLWSCDQCHVVPTEATSEGHMFDDTPGKAEVTFGAGLSDGGKYGSMTCSSLYCHGNGQGDNGSVPVNKSGVTCSSCHAGPTSSGTALGQMSGLHKKHVQEGIACQECHGEVLSGTTTFANPDLHVNGAKNVQMPGSITWGANGCNGNCHGEYHKNEAW
jgi:predicted CxxxxCH...CXXCH cytochrome family protein